MASTNLGSAGSAWQSLQRLAQTVARTVREHLDGVLAAFGHGSRGARSLPDTRPLPSARTGSPADAGAPPAVALDRAADASAARDELPPAYGRCRAVLVARDPWSLFAHWEVPPARRIEVLRWLDAEGEEAGAVLRLHDTTSVPATFHDIELPPGAERMHLPSDPGRSYRAEIGIRTRRGRFVPLAASGIASTPAALPSSDTSVRWVTVAAGGPPREAAVVWSGHRVPAHETATALSPAGPSAAAGSRAGASEAMPPGPRASDALPIR